MPYPNTNVLNIVIPQTSASIDPTSTQAPFVERIISGSRLVLQTDTTGTLIGSSDLNVNNITASNISASGYISASNLYVKTNITDAGSLIVTGVSTFNGLVSASANITSSNEYIAGTLTVVGNSTLSNVFATNITASNISASGNISSSTLYVTNNGTINGNLTVNGGNIVLSNTATNISLLDNVGGALDIKEAANSYIKIATTNAAENVTFGTTPTVYLIKTTDNDLLTYDNGALIIGGGVGINKNLFVGANTYTVGNSSITGSLTVGTTLRVNGNSTLSTVFATNVTASNISASGFISASNLRVENSTVDGGTMTVLGNTVLGDAVTDTTRITGSASISGSLSVVGNSTLQSTFVTNLTASNISASGFISGSDGVFAGDVAVNGGDITTTLVGTATLFNTNATSVTIGGAATGQVLLGNSGGTVKSAGDFIAGTNIIKDGAGGVAVTVTSALTTIAGDLQVNGNDIKDSGGNTNITLGINEVTVPIDLYVSRTDNATSYTDTNAALRVDGGARISKDAWISGSLNVAGDFTVFGSSSVVYISSSTVIINDNIIQLNAFFPYERYAGFEVFDSGSAQRSASLLWDGQNDNWITVDQNNTSSNIILGPTASFGNDPGSLTANNIPKAYDATGITTSSLSDDGTTLTYVGTTISSSRLLATTGSITYINGTLSTYTTGSFTALTVITGSAPGTGSQVPATPTSPGMHGQIEVDNNFIYVYTNNIWKRVPLSNWAP